MMKSAWLVAAVILLATPVLAQENLEPEDAPLAFGLFPSLASGVPLPRLYGQDYARSLKPEIGNDVRVFAVVEGGLIPDFVVGLKTTKSGYKIFTISEKRNGGLDRCEAPIDNVLAQDIIITWDKVLRQTRARVGKPMGGADVPFFHFGSRLPSGLVMGRVWDTPHDSNPAQLGRVALGLMEICSPQRLEPVSEALAGTRAALKAVH